MKSSSSDHALAVFKAALNCVPVIGGPIASLLGDYVPSSRQRAAEKAAEMLADKVADLEERIDSKAIDQEQFADLFGQFEALLAKTNREEKLRAAVNILANALLPANDPNKSPFDELDHLMHCLDALSSGAIAVLGASIQIRAPNHASGADRPFYFTELRQQFPSHNPDLVFGLATELQHFNLLHITEGIVGSRDFENYLFRVTPLGSRFAERFIEGKM